MTASRDPDRQIHRFLLEGEEELQDQVYDAVRAEIERKRQRVVIGPWRTPTMNRIVGFGLAAAAVVAAVFVGAQLLGSPNGGLNVGGDPTPSAGGPTPTPGLESYIGEYIDTAGEIVLRIYPADDEVCQNLEVTTICWSLGNAANPLDGAQGSASMEDGLLALLNTDCPNCIPEEVGATNFFEPRAGGVLFGLHCEPEGVNCPDEGHTYERRD